MSATVASLIGARIAAQPDSVRSLPDAERDRLIISAVKVNGTWVIKSLYGHDVWELTGAPSNRAAGHTRLDFSRVPKAFRSVVKEVMYRYSVRGREGSARPAATTMVVLLGRLLPFLRHLAALKLEHLGSVTPMVCAMYVTACKEERQALRRKGTPLSATSLENRFLAVENLYELSQFTETPIPSHPWPESSAKHLAGLTGEQYRSKTPLIPDDVFTTLFNEASSIVGRGSALLDLRDGLEELEVDLKNTPRTTAEAIRRRHLKQQGWRGDFRSFKVALTDLRTACYIVVASLSGCRNHELAYVQTGACYRTEDDEGEVYWWMRSRSDKTGIGLTEWMIPAAAVRALEVMGRWAKPLQARVLAEIALRVAANPLDPEIAEAQRHVSAVFLGSDKNRSTKVRTLTDGAWHGSLKSFATRLGLKWTLSTHQFRRKFANYAARSSYGDLRYLREHFKHWSQDMTNDGYALNESQEMELYAEIQDELDAIKLGVVEQWLNPAEPLAGGYGKNLVAWRSRGENIVLFKDRATMVRSVAESHAIRSNGHAWCTADDNGCIGNTLEKTRCSGCDNSVIGTFHARLYQQLYRDLKEVANCDDIGEGGKLRVLRDMQRCRDVLLSLGYEPEAQAA